MMELPNVGEKAMQKANLGDKALQRKGKGLTRDSDYDDDD